MKVGALCYACASGLGVLAKSFFDHRIITHPYIVKHAHHETHPEWFPGAPMTPIRQTESPEVQQWLSGLDVFLALETPFSWGNFDYCRQRGIKTILEVMYECEPRVLPSQPDLFLCPSLLDLQYFPERSVFIPVPVEVPWRQRTRAEVWLHVAGHGGLKGRNGTGELLDAMKHVKSPIKLIIRTQKPLQWSVDDPRVEVRVGTVPYEELWQEGDVCIHPTKFDALSLPLQEARAAGMLVVTGARFPMTEWLPLEPLIPINKYVRDCVSPRCVEFDSACYDPKDIAVTIDHWHGRDITEFSTSGRVWAESMSWAALGPKYKQVLEGLCNGS